MFISVICYMISTSWFFMLIFLLPFAALLIWLMKQDKKKGIIGIIIMVIMVAVGIIVSLKASKNAVNNFEMRKSEAVK